MPHQVQILDIVLERLDVYSPIDGCLYGVMYEGKLLVVGVGFKMEVAVGRGPIWHESAQQIYPTGIDWCGVFTIDNDINDPVLPEVRKKMRDVAVTNNPLYLRKDLNTGNIQFYYADGANLKSCDYQEVNKTEFMEKFVYLRLIGMIRVCFPITATSRQVNKEMEKLSARVAAGLHFQLGESDIYLNKYSNRYEHSSLGVVFNSLRKERDFRFDLDVLSVYALFPQGPSAKEVTSIIKPHIDDYTHPQIVKRKHGKHFKMLMNLPFDALCIAHRERNMDNVYDLLIDTAERTVSLCESYLIKYIDDPLKVHNLRAYHFFPTELAHPLSLVLSTEHDDERLALIRRQIHAFLNLPLDKPYFRKPNSFIFFPTNFIPSPLINVHIGVRPSGISSEHSKSSIVKGAYYYYHYMMDDINDNGWGCAYRSLQTIFSWFKLQGYTTLEVPTHSQIQGCLVALGDKPADFKGSNTWIGSAEVAYVLEIMLKASCRILNVSSGSNMSSLGTAIYEHFIGQGVPIMIGGGVLAHTILGIDIDEESGDMKFLILDPHYSENDDMSKIQRKGFVGWKGIDFWDSKSFYNLCLPQAPRCY